MRTSLIGVKLDGHTLFVDLQSHANNNAYLFDRYGAIAKIVNSEYLTLKMMVKEVSEIANNFVGEVLISTRTSLPKMVLLDSTISSR